MKKLLLSLFGLFFALNAFGAIYGADPITFKDRGYVSNIQNPNFKEVCAMGLVTECSFVPVYGENPVLSDAGGEEVWDGGGDYTYEAFGAASTVSMASSSASDVTPDITITGLNVTGDLVTQTITLTGQTRVALTTALWRVLDIENNSTTAAVGNIFVYTGTSTVPSIGDSEVRGVILAANNKAHMGMYTIPNDKVGILVKTGTGLTVVDVDKDLVSNLLIRKVGKTFSFIKKILLSSLNPVPYANKPTIVIPGHSDIKYRITDCSSDALGAFGEFELLIFDEDYFEASFLTAIGQP